MSGMNGISRDAEATGALEEGATVTGAGVIGDLVTGAADLTGAAVTGSDGADDCEGVEVDGLVDGEGDGAGDSVGELLLSMVGV